MEGDGKVMRQGQHGAEGRGQVGGGGMKKSRGERREGWDMG